MTYSKKLSKCELQRYYKNRPLSYNGYKLKLFIANNLCVILRVRIYLYKLNFTFKDGVEIIIILIKLRYVYLYIYVVDTSGRTINYLVN